MYRGWSTADLDKLKVEGEHLIQPCIWSYPGDKNVFEHITNEGQLGNTLVNFNKIWVASAYKGCYHPNNTYVDHELRFMNHNNWIEYVKKS